MRYVIEFGIRGGNHSGNIVLNSKKAGAELAAALVHVFLGVEKEFHMSSANRSWWKLERNEPRKTWTSSFHFVALSKLDGVPRGDATSTLWRKDETNNPT